MPAPPTVGPTSILSAARSTISLTGQPPFPTGTTIEKLNLHLKSAPPSVATKRNDVPVELLRILDKMLAKAPAQRYQTPGELAKDLAPLAKGADSPANGRRQPPGNVAPLAAATLAPGDLVPVPSTEYPVLSTSPLDDPALALSISPLRLVIQPPQPTALPFGLTPPAAVGIGVGSVALLALLAWAISAAFSGNGDPADQVAQQQTNVAGSSNHTVPPTPLNSPIDQSPPTTPAVVNASTPPSPPADGTGVIGKSLPQRVLLVVPSRGLHLPDYNKLRLAFEDKLGMQLDVASTTSDSVQTLSGAAGPVPDLLVNDSLKATDYGAIIFAGLSTDEYHPGTETGNQVARLLKEFERENKVIASICAGQRTLARHGYLNDKKAAYCQYLEPDDVVPTWDYTQLVVEDGKVITARADSDAGNLAQRIANHLGK